MFLSGHSIVKKHSILFAYKAEDMVWYESLKMFATVLPVV